MISGYSLANAALACLLLLALGAATGRDAQARMYQWQNPATGTAQLSGEPPAWYRSAQGGPRVRVFDNGNLVDDTAIELPVTQRESLREAAFRESEQRQRAEAVKRLEQAARLEQRRREEIERVAQERSARERERQTAAAAAQAESAQAPGTADPLAATDGTLDEATVQRLKAIISEFDRSGGRRKAP